MARLAQWAQTKRRRGYRKAHHALIKAGVSASPNRVHRLWQRAKLQVKRRIGKKGKPPGDPKAPILYPKRPGEVWSVDFIFDATAAGGKLKMLTVGDDFTRQCLAIEVATSFPATKVIAVLNRLVSQHGAPTYVKSDNGSEFTAHLVQAWACGTRNKKSFHCAGKSLAEWVSGEFPQSFSRRVSFRNAICFGCRSAGLDRSVASRVQ